MRHTLAISLLLLAAPAARADFGYDNWPSNDYAVAAVRLQGFYGNCWGAAINQYGDLAAFCSWAPNGVSNVNLMIYSGPTSWDQRLLGAYVGGYHTIEQYIDFEITPAGDFDIWAGLPTLTYRETVIVDHNRTALGPGQIAGIFEGGGSLNLPPIFDDYDWWGCWVGYVATPIPQPVPEPQALLLFATVIIASLRHGLRRASLNTTRSAFRR